MNPVSGENQADRNPRGFARSPWTRMALSATTSRGKWFRVLIFHVFPGFGILEF